MSPYFSTQHERILPNGIGSSRTKA